MVRSSPQLVIHKKWSSFDLEQLSGVSQALLRDWRRRKLAPASDGRRIVLGDVAKLFIQSELVAHGFGPKSVTSIAEEYAWPLMQYALMEPKSWLDGDSHQAWLATLASKCGARYVVITGRAIEAQSVDTFTDVLLHTASVVTVLDLKSLGMRLSSHLAKRPSSASNISERGTK